MRRASRSKTLLTLLLLIALIAAPAGAQPAKEDAVTTVRDANAFALELYAQLARVNPEKDQKAENLFFSPFSIHSALAMTSAGARGSTLEQMGRTLHLTLPQERLHAAYGQWVQTLGAPPPLFRRGEVPFELVVANALWAQGGYPFHEPFKETLARHYKAGFNEVDYVRDTEGARKAINAWVEKQTREKIKELVPPGLLSEMSRLVLTNAIYFKSRWAEEFNEKFTKPLPFHLLGGRDKDVPMMYQQDRFNYGQTDNAQVLELPYKGHVLSMIVLLPKKNDGLAELEKGLTAGSLAAWTGTMERRKVKVTLPKFKMTSELRLSDVLKSMGMADAFEMKKADFSGIATAEPLFISEVLHKAYVDVNEEGTEAAAATAVVMMAGSEAPKPEEPVVFTADHPFVFLIRHNNSGTVLFMGRVTNP
jgi:serpin B